MKKEDIEERLSMRRAALSASNEAYLALLQGQVKSYTIGSRNLTRLDLPQLEASIRKLEKEIDQLEALSMGNGRRKAVGIIPRDI